MNKNFDDWKMPLVALAAFCLLTQAFAQAPAIRLLPTRIIRTADPVTEQLEKQLAEATNAVPAGTNAPAGKPSEPEDLAKAIKSVDFSRTPDALVQAVKGQKPGAKPSEVEQFRMAVLLGDWETVGAALKTLPTTEAMEAYDRLLKALAAGSQSAEQFYRQNPNQRNQPMIDEDGEPSPQPQPRQAEKRSLFLSDDFYAVLQAAPGDLDATYLPPISTLVRVAIGPGGKREFLSRLEHGLAGIGGTNAAGRKLAAQLLSSVGWMADSGPYLPLQREEWDNADTLTLVLTMEYFTQTGVEERDERQLKRAAELCAFMMQTSRFVTYDSAIFNQATERFVKLLPALESNDAEQLIRENFLAQPALMVDLLLALGESGQRKLSTPDLSARGQSLATQNVLLRVLASRKSSLPEAVNLLVMNWLTEAETTYRSGVTTLPNFNDFGNPYIYRPPSFYMNQRNQRVLLPELVLEQAPPAALIKRLNPGLAQRVNLTLLKVNLMDPKEPITVETLKGYLKDHPGQEKELCQDYLGAWVKKRSIKPEDPNIVRMRAMGYVISRPQQMGGGIPLTRLRQNQNVLEFKTLLATLRELSPEPLEASSIVQGFMAIHSGAEVYRAEDIEAIFGPAEKMNRNELMQLITGMRTKLRDQWKDPKVQQDAGTNRTEEETKDEVSRGYRTALDLAKRGLRPEDADWRQFIVRGQLFFDAAEYEFSRQIKLTDYVSLRDESFSSYRKAAEIYASKIPELPKGQWTLEPYQMWFFVMLGASDLSQLTRAAARSDPGLKQIGDAMRALPGEAADGHLEKFGKMLADLLSQVPANMKQRFLSAGLQVVGEDQPSAKPALEALNNYQELLDEAQLRVTVDGPTRVGHGQPFGVFLSLEHTRQLARESGGFSKYLQNLSTQQRMPVYIQQTQPGMNLRDDFAKNIHAALDETFEVSSITFHDPDVRAIDLPREGWQETPLAYLLIRAKEAAVDRIPSIQLDMDFSDTSGQVVLPVRSQVQPIDAKDPDSPVRPCEDLSLVFTMDEREWQQGRVVVEVTARARSVIPSHPQMFDFAQEGFEVEVTDNGLSVTEFVSDGKFRQAKSDRNWQFTYQRKKDLRADAVLKFPALKPEVKAASTEYKHYHDADLVSLTAQQASAGIPLSGTVSKGLRNALIGLIILVVGVAAYLFWRLRKRHEQVSRPGLALPAQITAFSVAAFLRRIQRDAGTRLDDQARQSLRTQIEEIETTFFRGVPAASAPDLDAIARKWLNIAGETH